MKERATKMERKNGDETGVFTTELGFTTGCHHSHRGGDHQFACIIAGKEGGEGRQMKDGRRFFRGRRVVPPTSPKKVPKSNLFRVKVLKSVWGGGSHVLKNIKI